MLKANVEQAENGYVVHLYSSEGVTKTFIADNAMQLAKIIAQHLVGKKKKGGE